MTTTKRLNALSSLPMVLSWRHLRCLIKWLAVYVALALPLGGLFRYPWHLPGVALRLSFAACVAVAEYVVRGCRPLFDEWTLPFEVVRAVSRAMSENYAYITMVPRIARYMRLQTEVVGTLMGAVTCWFQDTKTEPFRYNGLEHIWVRIKTNHSTATRRCVVLYLHGGGYAVLSPRFYISCVSDLLVRIQSELHDRDDIRVEALVANFRKAPEHPYPVPPDDAMLMYRYLVDVEGVAPQNILLVGDSAGAGLVLTTLIRLRDKNPSELPRAALLACPYVDLEMRGDQRKVPYCMIADGAVNVVAKMYVPWGGCPTTWGDASPLHCNLSGLPPVSIISAEFDYLLPQAQRLLERAREDGVETWELAVHKHMPHVFMAIPPWILPAASNGLNAMAKYAAVQLKSAGGASSVVKKSDDDDDDDGICFQRS